MSAFGVTYLLWERIWFAYLANPVLLVGPMLLRLAWVGGCGTGRMRMMHMLENSPAELLPAAGILQRWLE
jgi:hypothetical protein